MWNFGLGSDKVIGIACQEFLPPQQHQLGTAYIAANTWVAFLSSFGQMLLFGVSQLFVCLFCFVSFPMHYVFSFLNLWLYWLISLCLFTELIGFLNPDCLLFPASTVKRFLQVGTFFFFFYSSFTWCTWEVEHLITAGLGYADIAVVQEATCSHFRGAKQTILSLLRAAVHQPVIFWKHQVRSLLVIFLLVISGIEKDVQNCSQ